MNKDDLKVAASRLGLTVKDDDSNKQIVEKIKNAGISYATYKKLYLDEGEEMSKPESHPVLVKMDRQNFTFEAFGHKFTKEHPFVPMSEDDAQEIFDAYEGFRLATPSEVKNFYN